MSIVLLITKTYNLLLIKNLTTGTNQHKGTFICFVIIDYHKTSSQFEASSIHTP